MKVKFTKIKNNHSRLRDDVIVGKAKNPPQVGEIFFMTAAPKSKTASLRMINTSKIESVDDIENGWKFTTKSGSVYQVVTI